jgi:hypothetical protein
MITVLLYSSVYALYLLPHAYKPNTYEDELACYSVSIWVIIS